MSPADGLPAGEGRLAAITGGTGFLGRYCVAALAAAGWRVRLLVRRDPAHPLLAGLDLDLIHGDLADGAALARLVEGASVVVHAAGAIKARSATAFQATNRDGTARLAAAVRRIPDCRLIHISSQVARAPWLSPYAASKREGERALVAALGDGRSEWVILRPCVVYGPWDAATESLLRVAASRAVPAAARPGIAAGDGARARRGRRGVRVLHGALARRRGGPGIRGVRRRSRWPCLA